MPCNDLPTLFKAAAYQADLIKMEGEWNIRQGDTYLRKQIQIQAADPNEGTTPREFIRWSFTAMDHPNYTALNLNPNFGSEDVVVHNNCGPETVSISTATTDNLLCDLPHSTLQSGHDVHYGNFQGFRMDTEPVCIDNLARTHNLAAYFAGVQKALPTEAAIAHENSLFQNVLKFGEANAAITANLDLILGKGVIPDEPTHIVDLGFLKQHAEVLQANGWPGAVEYGISDSLLRAMIQAEKANYPGAQIPLTPFNNDFSPGWQPGTRVVFDGLTFLILAVPVRGYVQRIGLTSEFVRWEPRKFRAGTGAGVVPEVDLNFRNAYVKCNGIVYPLCEAIVCVHPKAAFREPYARPANPHEGRVGLAGKFAMDVQVVDGAHIPCNDLNTKFKYVITDAYKFGIHYPEWMGIILSRYQPYKRQLIVPPDPWCAFETIEVSGPRGVEPPNNACCDLAENMEDPDFDASAPRPIAPTSAVPRPVNVPGVFVAQCTVTVAAGATTIRISVDRQAGSLGAATLAYTTTPGTAVPITDYTTTSGTLSWANLEGGIKSTAVIPITPTSLGGVAFSVTFSAPTGAAFAVQSCHETCIKIPEPCAAADEIACPTGAGVAS